MRAFLLQCVFVASAAARLIAGKHPKGAGRDGCSAPWRCWRWPPRKAPRPRRRGRRGRPGDVRPEQLPMARAAGARYQRAMELDPDLALAVARVREGQHLKDTGDLPGAVSAFKGAARLA